MYVPSTDKDSPAMGKDDAESYAKAIIRDSARDTIHHSYEWKRYASHDKGIDWAKVRENGDTFWEKASQEFKDKVSKIAGQSICDKLTAAMGINKWLKAAKDVVTKSACREAVDDAIEQEIELCKAGKRSAEQYQDRKYKEPEPVKSDDESATPRGSVTIDIGHKNENAKSMTYSEQVVALADEVREDLVKAFAPKPNIADFVPRSREDLELFRSHGVVPKGFLSRAQVTDICPPCGAEMFKAQMPLIREERFRQDIAQRIVYDIHTNAEAWAEAMLKDENVDLLDEFSEEAWAGGYDVFKAREGLVRKVITDKRGRRQTKWVRPSKSEQKPKGGSTVASAVKSVAEKLWDDDASVSQMKAAADKLYEKYGKSSGLSSGDFFRKLQNYHTTRTADEAAEAKSLAGAAQREREGVKRHYGGGRRGGGKSSNEAKLASDVGRAERSRARRDYGGGGYFPKSDTDLNLIKGDMTCEYKGCKKPATTKLTLKGGEVMHTCDVCTPLAKKVYTVIDNCAMSGSKSYSKAEFIDFHKAGRKDVTKLTKKTITNKRGRRQTVYVKQVGPDDPENPITRSSLGGSEKPVKDLKTGEGFSIGGSIHVKRGKPTQYNKEYVVQRPGLSKDFSTAAGAQRYIEKLKSQGYGGAGSLDEKKKTEDAARMASAEASGIKVGVVVQLKSGNYADVVEVGPDGVKVRSHKDGKVKGPFHHSDLKVRRKMGGVTRREPIDQAMKRGNPFAKIRGVKRKSSEKKPKGAEKTLSSTPVKSRRKTPKHDPLATPESAVPKGKGVTVKSKPGKPPKPKKEPKAGPTPQGKTPKKAGIKVRPKKTSPVPKSRASAGASKAGKMDPNSDEYRIARNNFSFAVGQALGMALGGAMTKLRGKFGPKELKAAFERGEDPKKLAARLKKMMKGSDPIPIIGESLDLVDFLKAHPSKAIQAWAAKMKREGGDHPYTFCLKKARDFASDPNAFCAAVHLEAFGMTPSQRKAAKKGN